MKGICGIVLVGGVVAAGACLLLLEVLVEGNLADVEGAKKGICVGRADAAVAGGRGGGLRAVEACCLVDPC